MNEPYFIWAKNVIGHDFDIHQERGREGNKIFRLSWDKKSVFLKVCADLLKEKQKLEWLIQKLPVPKVLDFKKNNGTDYLLISAIEGEDLANLVGKWEPDIITTKLAQALIRFHSVDIKDWPFGKFKKGEVLLHGDVALPNIIYRDDGELSGYIDLGDLKVGDKERDLIDAVWTLQRNLGKGYGLSFLRQYGVLDADEKMVDEMYSKY